MTSDIITRKAAMRMASPVDGEMVSNETFRQFKLQTGLKPVPWHRGLYRLSDVKNAVAGNSGIVNANAAEAEALRRLAQWGTSR